MKSVNNRIDWPPAQQLVPRPRGRARTPPILGVGTFRWLLERSGWEPYPQAKVPCHKGRLALIRSGSAKQCQRPRNVLCHPFTTGRRQRIRE